MANVNKVRKLPVKIDIGDGQDRSLKYTLNAFAMLEEKYGSIDDAMAKMEEGSILAVRYALWVGLIHEDEELSELYVGNQIELSDLESMANLMNKAMMGDLPMDKTVPVAKSITASPKV